MGKAFKNNRRQMRQLLYEMLIKYLLIPILKKNYFISTYIFVGNFYVYGAINVGLKVMNAYHLKEMNLGSSGYVRGEKLFSEIAITIIQDR